MAYFAKASYDLKHMIWFLGLSGTTPAQSGSGAGNRGRCVMDVDGNMYGQGDTTFSNFPVCGGPYSGSCASRSSSAMQTTIGSAGGWIAKVKADGSDVVYSSYLASSGSVGPACEGGNTLSSFTSSNPIYYAACNVSPANPVTSTNFFAGAEGTGFQKHPFSGSRVGGTGYSNSALFRVNPGCNRGGVTGRECIDASTYYGGNTVPSGVAAGGTNGWPQQMRLSPNGDIYVNVEQVYTDPAGCATYPCSTGVAGQVPNGYQTKNYSALIGGQSFGPTVTMLLDFSPDFAQLKNVTYIGGSGSEYVGGDGGMYIDPSGNIWTMSQTTSVPGYGYSHLFPASSNAHSHATDPNGPVPHAYGTADSGTNQYGFAAAMVELDPTLHNLLYGSVYSPDNHSSEYSGGSGPSGLLTRDMQWYPYNNSPVIHGSTGLTVTAPVLVSIVVTPANPSISAGTQQQFTATGTYTDGSHQDLTNSATWISSAPSVATISNTGLATAQAVGSTTMQATSGSIHGSTGLTVTPPQAQVSLAWTASTSQDVVGYNAYRSMISGGPYTKLNSSLIATTSYTDQGVETKNTYYYVTTAVNSQGLESVYSDEAAASWIQ